MTIANVVEGFQTACVFPLKRDAIKLPENVMEKLPEQSGLKFISLYCPANPKKCRLNFSEDELKYVLRRAMTCLINVMMPGWRVPSFGGGGGHVHLYWVSIY